MMTGKSATTIQGLSDPRHKAHAVNTSVSPRYIGLRLTRYIPCTTRLEAKCGFKGLMVVCARRKRVLASNMMPSPTAAGSSANHVQMCNCLNGIHRCNVHIRKAAINQTTGGGTRGFMHAAETASSKRRKADDFF